MVTKPTLGARIQARLDSLTKPPGSLGRLEEIATRYAQIRGDLLPPVPARKAVYIFCGDHGVTEAGISAYPSEVTGQMVANFAAGGAAITVLCRQIGAEPVIVDVGVSGPPHPGALKRRIAPGTRNFLLQTAMDRAQAEAAIDTGRALAREAADRFDLVALGEMGIGNTTSAAAVVSAITGVDPERTAGPGAGLTPAGVQHKIDVIRRALAAHQPSPTDPLSVLAAVGGFEIGAIAGFVLGAAARRLPVVLDGYPCCAGALLARALCPSALETAFFGHISQEPGHRILLEQLAARPLLDLGMRLGEGTGATLAMSLIESAVRLYREMATFEEAQVSSAR